MRLCVYGVYVLMEGGGAALRRNYNDALHMIKKKINELDNSESPHGTGYMKMCRHEVNTETKS